MAAILKSFLSEQECATYDDFCFGPIVTRNFQKGDEFLTLDRDRDKRPPEGIFGVK